MSDSGASNPAERRTRSSCRSCFGRIATQQPARRAPREPLIAGVIAVVVIVLVGVFSWQVSPVPPGAALRTVIKPQVNASPTAAEQGPDALSRSSALESPRWCVSAPSLALEAPRRRRDPPSTEQNRKPVRKFTSRLRQGAIGARARPRRRPPIRHLHRLRIRREYCVLVLGGSETAYYVMNSIAHLPESSTPAACTRQSMRRRAKRLRRSREHQQLQPLQLAGDTVAQANPTGSGGGRGPQRRQRPASRAVDTGCGPIVILEDGCGGGYDD